MTNSIKHYPFAAFVGGSNAGWKRCANRELRRTNKQLLQAGKELRIMREEANLYDSPLDGSVHFVQKACRKVKLYRPRGLKINATGEIMVEKTKSLRIILRDVDVWWKPKVFRK